MDNEETEQTIPARFLASILHEIRTPIQTIISTIELLDDTNLDTEQKEYVHQINFSTNVLLELANDILDFTKIKSGKFKIETIPIDITDLTEQVVDIMAIEGFNKGLEIITDIDYSIPRFVLGDPVRIQQIILNLVKNAVKFTHKGYIIVKLSSYKNSLFFRIIDSGIGISKEKQKLVFMDYYQGDTSTTRKYGGTGLGLPISKSLVQTMEGSIGVTENIYGGSIFWFKIPLIKAVNSTVINDHVLIIPPDTKILIVDDSTLAADSLKKKLNGLNISSITVVSNGEKAIEALQNAVSAGKPYSHAFIDMIMPIMDGWRLAADITRNHSINNTKLYLVIPEGQMGADAKMKMLNWFNGYLYKPVKRVKLETLLKESFSDEMSLETIEPTVIKPKQTNISVTQKVLILIAEDHPMNQKLMKAFLEKTGAEIFLAGNGNEAINQVKNHPDMDIIFMDIQMPEKDGIQASIELRNDGYKGIIIACTANCDPDNVIKYKQMGINDILVKPFKRSDIHILIEKWITVLSLPDAKQISFMTDIENRSSAVWDLADFLNTTGNNVKLAVELTDKYIEQTEIILQEIENEIHTNTCNFSLLERLGHTLNGSSATISAHTLSEYGIKINKAAIKQNKPAIQSIRIDFLCDFIQFKQNAALWKASLENI